jgi:hypothetical protein
LRPGRLDDANEAGRIIFETFAAVAEKYGFPPDFPSVDVEQSSNIPYLQAVSTQSSCPMAIMDTTFTIKVTPTNIKETIFNVYIGVEDTGID